MVLVIDCTMTFHALFICKTCEHMSLHMVYRICGLKTSQVIFES